MSDTTMPAIPVIPMLTESRLYEALLDYLSRERTIAEAAACRGISETNLRDLIKRDPFHAASVRVVGRKSDGSPIVKTDMRSQWVAQDNAARAASQVVLRSRTPRARKGARA